jgi:DNA-binding protein HU-beta
VIIVKISLINLKKMKIQSKIGKYIYCLLALINDSREIKYFWRCKMNKTELIAKVAEKANFSKKDADIALKAVLDSITETLTEGEKVQIVGFGTFEVRERSERQGRDPRTNTPITIPASKSPVFKAGKSFKTAVDK